ncbi:MAG: lipopolysaccharide biosynthesis protein [Methylococcaceae bacterium]
MDIRTKVLSALRWTVGARFAGQLFNWSITIIVIRLLDPSDYGLLAMTTIFTSFLFLFNTLGLDTILVQKKDLDETERRRIFGVVILTNLVIYAGLFVCAPLIADFFGEPRLVSLVRIQALMFPLSIFKTLPLTKLERTMAFKHRSLVELTTMVISSISTLVLAYQGYGVWSLVYGSLIMLTVDTLGLNIISPEWCRPDFSIAKLNKTMYFGGYVILGRGLRYIYTQSDKFIGGRIMGTDTLGYYSVASHLASLPIQKLTGIMNSIALPAFAEANHTTDKTGIYYLKANRITCALAFPGFFGISCIAPELVKILLGNKWEAAILPISILALVMPFRALGNLFTPLLLGIGQPKTNAINLLIAAVIMPIVFLIGAQWGAYGMSLGWLLAYPIVYLISLKRTCPRIGVKIVDSLKTMFGPLVSSIAMYAVVISLNDIVFGVSGEIVHLVQLVTIGIMTYTTIMFLFFRESLSSVSDLLKR